MSAVFDEHFGKVPAMESPEGPIFETDAIAHYSKNFIDPWHLFSNTGD